MVVGYWQKQNSSTVKTMFGESFGTARRSFAPKPFFANSAIPLRSLRLQALFLFDRVDHLPPTKNPPSRMF
jgi:hypothetical protein